MSFINYVYIIRLIHVYYKSICIIKHYKSICTIKLTWQTCYFGISLGHLGFAHLEPTCYEQHNLILFAKVFYKQK